MNTRFIDFSPEFANAQASPRAFFAERNGAEIGSLILPIGRTWGDGAYGFLLSAMYFSSFFRSGESGRFLRNCSYSAAALSFIPAP